MGASRLPALKTLADFDFSFQPSIKREQVDALYELGFVERKENIVYLGPPRIGKTHLAISLASPPPIAHAGSTAAPLPDSSTPSRKPAPPAT